MPAPTFLIIGAQKCGTTWLSHRLDQHPQVFTVDGTYFFDNPKNYAKGFGWYCAQFRDAGDAIAIGEKTPSYLWGEKFPASGDPANVPRRVKDLLPDVRIIAVLRDPATRAISHFNHSIRSGKLSPWSNIDRILTRRDAETARGLGIHERGLYAAQLRRWLQFFPRDQLRVILFEQDVVQSPTECLHGLCEFLRVDSNVTFATANTKENEKLSRTELIIKYYAPPLRQALRPILKRLPKRSFQPKPETIADLESYYEQANAELAALLGVNVSCWAKRRAA